VATHWVNVTFNKADLCTPTRSVFPSPNQDTLLSNFMVFPPALQSSAQHLEGSNQGASYCLVCSSLEHSPWRDEPHGLTATKADFPRPIWLCMPSLRWLLHPYPPCAALHTRFCSGTHHVHIQLPLMVP
jgi:hypothetical protein